MNQHLHHSDDARRHLVWVCAGCEKCEEPSTDGVTHGAPIEPDGPCTDTSPSMNGKWVVLADDHERIIAAIVAGARASIDSLYNQAKEQMAGHGSHPFDPTGYFEYSLGTMGYAYQTQSYKELHAEAARLRATIERAAAELGDGDDEDVWSPGNRAFAVLMAGLEANV